MRRRGLLCCALLAAALAAAACGRGDAPTPADGPFVDEFGDPILQPPTREEILAEPARYGPDAVIEVLTELAEDTDADALPAVLALRSDPREEVRWHVVEALHGIGGDAARAALAEMAATDDSALVREVAGETR